MHEKALSVPADEVVFDLEDAVAPSAKPEAREAIARQVATLDALSGGRVIFGAGLGGPIEDEFGSVGDCTDPRVLAARLDEGLELLCRYWSGDVVNHDGPHFQVHDVRLLPGSVQRPRPPIWIGGFWPRRRPMRRAAQWDGVAPLFDTARHGQILGCPRGARARGLCRPAPPRP